MLEKNFGKLNNKKILIFQQRAWGMRIGHFLAKKLYYEEGCKLAALTLKKSTHKFITEQREVKYEYIVNIDEIFENPEKNLDKENISLKEICKELNIDSVWPMIQSNRLFVKSYKEKFYYSFRQNVSDEFIILYLKSYYKAIRDLFENFKPDAVIMASIIYEGHIIVSLFADKYNIPVISVTDSKIFGYNIFSHNYNSDRGFFYKRIDELNSGEIETENRNKAKNYIREFRENFKKPIETFRLNKKKSLIQKVRYELSPYYHILRWYIKGPSINVLKNIGASIDYKPPKIILRDHYCFKKYKKFMDKFNYYPFDEIKKFVYFPLQVQPESMIDCAAPYFNNQIEIARLTAMSLPDDYTLVVKEHPAMLGLRTPSYLEKIAKTPNVKLIDYRISTEDIFKKTDLIISPNSTSIAEAAFYYKPAIQLGDLSLTLKLPNVFKHTDMTTLTAKIKEVLKIDLRNGDYERRLENYVAAVYDTGFKFDYWGAWEGSVKGDMDHLWQIWKKEIERVLFT
ncbi:hypothetical protein KJ840_05005 [Patescibacteria group bacterium]|nr:hypothetical protein [Patescibacteria group bacterium]